MYKSSKILASNEKTMQSAQNGSDKHLIEESDRHKDNDYGCILCTII